MPTRPNATRADIVAMLRDGHSNTRIVRELRVDKARVRRIREELGLPSFVPTEQTRTIEEKWALFAQPGDGGHMEWTGERAKASGTPLLTYKEKHHSAAAVAFRIRTGRAPKGYAIADCKVKHCVAPDHVNDEAGRQQARHELRVRQGLGEVPAKCARGHSHAEHGLLAPDGTAYCGLCNLLDKRAQRDPTAPRPAPRRPPSLQEAFEQHTELLDSGHVRWTGSASHTTPTLWWQGTTYSAYKVAFCLHYGRQPDGLVTPGCNVPLCVAGGCLTDRRLREANRRADAAYEALFGGAA